MAAASATIGVDVGTSGCKAVLRTGDGRVVHAATAGYPTYRALDGEVTQDPREWLAAVRTTVRECARRADGLSIDGLGVTAPAHVGVLADANGDPLARSLLAFDGRPAAVAAELQARYGDAYSAGSFVRLTAGWTLPQLAWQRSVAPELWPRIRWLLTQKDWIRFRLTGVPLIDHSDAAGTGMIDQRSGTWLADVCRDVGLGERELPPIVPSTAPGGHLDRRWARTMGLRAGIPVVVGATDTAAELVSVGASRAGSSLVKIASTGTVVGVSAEPVVDPRLLTYPHAVPGLWYSLGATNAAAAAYGWLRHAAFGARPGDPATTYREMDRLAARAPAGAGGVLFLPFLQGERTPYWDPRLRAAFFGLASSHGPEHLARAVLEGVACSLRACRESVEASGLVVRRPFLGGGGMSSRLWRQILVAVLDMPCRLTEPQGPAVGAAMLAAAPGARTAAELAGPSPAPVARELRPIAGWATRYHALYGTYQRCAEHVASVSHELVAIEDR